MMFRFPVHSPRHISTPTASSSSQTLTTATLSNPNTDPKKRSISVLDEDSYVAFIEKIIERDFFLDIPKLRDRLDWLEAVRSVDPILIRDAQLKILERGRSKNCNPNFTPSNPSTLGGGLSSTPFRSDSTPLIFHKNPTPNPESSDDAPVDSNLTMDEFFKRYTSEDNESFNKILEKVNRKRKEKYSHLLEGEKEQILTLEDGKNKDGITDGYGTSD